MKKPLLHNCYLKLHEVVTDARGHLLPIEAGRDVPFAIERVYFLYGTSAGSERGFHAHRTLHQQVFCAAGSCTVILDDGRERLPVILDTPDQSLHIGPMIWRELRDFSKDCFLVTLASAPYRESDYIRDRDRFLAETLNR